MRKLTIGLIFLLVLSLLLMLVACGNKTEPETPVTTDKPPTDFNEIFHTAVNSNNMTITVNQISTRTSLKGNNSIEYRATSGAAYICIDATVTSNTNTDLTAAGAFKTSEETFEGVDIYVKTNEDEYAPFNRNLTKDTATNLLFCIPAKDTNTAGELTLMLDGQTFITENYRPGSILPLPPKITETAAETTPAEPKDGQQATFAIQEIGYKDIIKAANSVSDTNAFTPSSHDDTFLYARLGITNITDTVLSAKDIVVMHITYADGESYDLSSVFVENEGGTELAIGGKIAQRETANCIAIVKVPKAKQSLDGDLSIGVPGNVYLLEAPKN